MTELHFQKWQATGNDFVIVDNRLEILTDLSPEFIRRICDRKYGIGADGFMFIRNHPDFDFEMHYFNSDGHEAEMCGNGGRSIIGFAKGLGIIQSQTEFWAIDGIHQAWTLGEDQYRIQMVNVKGIKAERDSAFLNTGVPHLVLFTDDPQAVDVVARGRKWRYDPAFAPKGTNVNFINFSGNTVQMRTYERGVEDETLSCGTGAVASAIATEFKQNAGFSEYQVQVPGGRLKVRFHRSGPEEFEQIFLEGEALLVFKGSILL